MELLFSSHVLDCPSFPTWQCKDGDRGQGTGVPAVWSPVDSMAWHALRWWAHGTL